VAGDTTARGVVCVHAGSIPRSVRRPSGGRSPGGAACVVAVVVLGGCGVLAAACDGRRGDRVHGGHDSQTVGVTTRLRKCRTIT
jgi:hypothetical protein